MSGSKRFEDEKEKMKCFFYKLIFKIFNNHFFLVKYIYNKFHFSNNKIDEICFNSTKTTSLQELRLLKILEIYILVKFTKNMFNKIILVLCINFLILYVLME